jgi:circadian clock protein KaiC
MISVLTALGVTVLMTAELEDRYTDLRFSSYGNAFLADAIILQRYVELGGQFKRVVSVIKVRGSDHSKNVHLFDIVNDEMRIDENPIQIEGVFSGRPREIFGAAPN